MKLFSFCSTLLLFLSFAPRVHGQTSVVFLPSTAHVIANEPRVDLPTGFLDGLTLALGDTTLGSRILNSMELTLARTRPVGRYGIAASLIVPGQPQWSGAVGNSDPTTELDTNMLFEVASNTKTFVAALILQLRDEGKLSLSDSIHHWLPKFKNVDSTITIQQLLSHSSGLYDYLNDGWDLLDSMYNYTPSRHWTQAEILNNHLGVPHFKPGASYRYCNTGFLILGMVAERAGGATLGTQLHARFIDPLKLTNTFVGGDDSLQASFSHNWSGVDTTAPETDLYLLDKTAQLTGSYGVGNVVSTVGDLARWGHALYTGRVLSKSSLAQMVTVKLWPDGEYGGLGTFRIPYYTRSFFGHTGHLPGYLSYNFTNLADSVSFCIYQNSEPLPGDPTINDYALDLLTEVYRAPNRVTSERASRVVCFAYPNPARDVATIACSLTHPSNIALEMYDGSGNLVRSVHTSEVRSAGIQRLRLDLSGLSSGTYIYSLRTAIGLSTGKLQVER